MTGDSPVPPGTERTEHTCEESLAVVYEYLDGELNPEQHELVRRHLEQCRKCYPYFNFERLFLDYLREVGETSRPSADLERRVRDLLKTDTG
jgi:anti-sigma factor (TIGR02949 family)